MWIVCPTQSSSFFGPGTVTFISLCPLQWNSPKAASKTCCSVRYSAETCISGFWPNSGCLIACLHGRGVGASNDGLSESITGPMWKKQESHNIITETRWRQQDTIFLYCGNMIAASVAASFLSFFLPGFSRSRLGKFPCVFLLSFR